MIWFFMLFNSYQVSDKMSNHTGQILLGIYMFKGNNKNIRTIYETCLKLKLKNKYSETTLSNGVLLSLLLPFERIFYLVLVFLLLTLNI